MTDHGSMVEGRATAELLLSSSEYRLLADLLLGHLQANDLQDEQLENLVNHLYVLAVRVVPSGRDP
ncbi:hypothetical protein [Deinococcus humi]|uniref:Uncharacterized protein n=1 Tax=Deinococcus humi TaxID=662880 RepID=A0A7W8JZ33_9DEIO|nr:hypothetical protein [Deinococcus humi]MBB5365887.1 hypothetical protein [Deinococcus humi]GGO38787.1 hypothetical protein GCM10008949_45930 [Deinococcus humi]